MLDEGRVSHSIEVFRLRIGMDDLTYSFIYMALIRCKS